MKELVSEIDMLLQKVPRPPGEVIPHGLDVERVGEFSKRTGLQVSNDLAEWLRLSNGPCVGPGGLYGIKPDRDYLDIEQVFRLYPHFQTNGWIPVASDGCGNFYVACTNGGASPESPVVFIDVADDPQSPAYVVASNVLVFVKRLLEKELVDSGWPFNKEWVLERDPGIQDVRDVPLPWET